MEGSEAKRSEQSKEEPREEKRRGEMIDLSGQRKGKGEGRKRERKRENANYQYQK